MLVWLQAELAVIFMLLALTFICERSKRSASGLVSTPAIEVYLARLRRAHLLLLSAYRYCPAALTMIVCPLPHTSCVHLD